MSKKKAYRIEFELTFCASAVEDKDGEVEINDIEGSLDVEAMVLSGKSKVDPVKLCEKVIQGNKKYMTKTITCEMQNSDLMHIKNFEVTDISPIYTDRLDNDDDIDDYYDDILHIGLVDWNYM